VHGESTAILGDGARCWRRSPLLGWQRRALPLLRLSRHYRRPTPPTSSTPSSSLALELCVARHRRQPPLPFPPPRAQGCHAPAAALTLGEWAEGGVLAAGLGCPPHGSRLAPRPAMRVRCRPPPRPPRALLGLPGGAGHCCRCPASASGRSGLPLQSSLPPFCMTTSGWPVPRPASMRGCGGWCARRLSRPWTVADAPWR
jgi:hypothetical protein